MSDRSENVSSITIASSGWGIITTGLGLAGFCFVAVAIVALNGLNVVTGAIVIAAVAAATVLALDLPVAATFETAGILRSTPLRRKRIQWSEVDRLVRLRRGGIRRPGSPRSKGIVAVTENGRRIILVDRTETVEEHRHLVEVLTNALVAADRFESLGEPTENVSDCPPPKPLRF